MVASMSCKGSNILMPATMSLAADIPLLRSASSPKRRSMAWASGRSVAHPRSAPRTSYMYVLDELASTPLMAIPVPTVPHSSVLACMTLSWASHAIPTVATPWAASRGSPLAPCHCWDLGFIALVWSMPWSMRRTASFVPSGPVVPVWSPTCASATEAGSSDTRP